MAFYKVCGNYYGTDNDANSLMHYRTPGSKNGVRKYQYEDGTLTPAGKIHYGVGKGNGSQTGVSPDMIKYQKVTGAHTSYSHNPNNFTGQEYASDVVKNVRMTPNSDIARKARKSVFGNDARPTGINKAVYDATIWGRQAASDVNKAVGDAKNWVGDRASDVKNWGEQAGRDVGKAVDNAKNWVGDRASDVKNWGEQAVGNVKKAGDKTGDWARDRASDVKNWGEEAVGNVRKAGDSVGDWVGGRANDVNRAVGDAKNWVGARANDVKNFVSGRPVDDAKNWVGDRASDVKNWGEQAVGNVKKAGDKTGDWVGDRASDVKKAGDKVGDWVGAKAKDVSSWGSGAVNKGRDFITGLFGNKKKQSAPEPKKSNAIDLKKIAGKNVSKPKK